MKKGRQKEREEFVRLAAKQTLFAGLNENQRKFLRLIKERGVLIQMTEEARRDKGFQELVGLLVDMHKDGIIPSFQVVKA